MVTDQTSAHDTLTGYIPQGYTLESAKALRESDRKRYIDLARAINSSPCGGHASLSKQGAIVFDDGNNIARWLSIVVLKMHLLFLDLCLLSLDPCFVKAKDHFAGQHYQAILMTSPLLTRRNRQFRS